MINKIDVIFITIMFILMIGFFLNRLVIYTNKNKMPVLTETEEFDTERHFSFDDSDKGKVKLWFFSDIFTIETKNRVLSFSIGDIFIILSVLTYIILWITINFIYK